MIMPVTGDLQETGKTMMKNVDDLSGDTEGPVVMEENSSYKREKGKIKLSEKKQGKSQ